MPGTNPYTFGDPVGKSPSFVGREDILKDMLRVLRHPEQNAITLYGQRRIGKTSILQYLEIHLPENGPFIPIYFDLMGRSGLPLGEILRQMACIIAQKLNQPDPDLGDNQEQSFRDAYLPNTLHNLPAEASLVFLLDEFDVLADPQAEQQAKRQFYSYMRDLRQLNPARLQFVFTLGRNLEDMDIVARALFKDLPARRVSLLTYEEMETLVRLSERADGLQWSREAVQRVWALTGGHPYLTQALCSHIWEDAFVGEETKRRIEPEDVEAAVPHALESSHNMLVWLWDGLGPAEKVVASALASAGPTVVNEDRLSAILAESGVRIMIGELRDAPQVLQQWDILAPADGGYRFRVELLRRWIAENKPLSRTQEELDRINPVAENLFAAARGLYLNGELGPAEGLLRQTLQLNPNHLGAHELLAEILMARGAIDDAQTLLEKLADLAPGRARPRLKQIYLQRAEWTTDHPEKLAWYERVLQLLPGDPQASEAYRNTYISMVLENVRDLEEREAFGEAFELLQALADQYPAERDWRPDLERLGTQALLSSKYEQALGALQQGDRARAQRLLAEIMVQDPGYKEVGRYMYIAITGNDPETMMQTLTEAQTEVQRLKREIERLQSRPSSHSTKPRRRSPSEKPQKPSPEPPRESIPSLSPKNPLHHLRLFWRILANPRQLQSFRESFDEDTWYTVGNRIAYTLALLPLLLLFLGFSIGTIPNVTGSMGSSHYTQYATIALIGLWGLLMLLAHEVRSAAIPNVAGAIAFLFATTAFIGIATPLTQGDTQIVEGSLSGLIGLLLTISLGMGTVYGMAHYIANEENIRTLVKGTRWGIAVGIAYVMARFAGSMLQESLVKSMEDGMLSQTTISMISVTTGIVSITAGLAVALIVNSTVGEMAETIAIGLIDAFEKKKPIPWALILLIIHGVALAFFSFGGLAWMQTGAWPQPAWLSEKGIIGF